jgi:hypothetical protein
MTPYFTRHSTYYSNATITAYCVLLFALNHVYLIAQEASSDKQQASTNSDTEWNSSRRVE